MSQADRFRPTETTTMQDETAGFLLFYADESHDNTTEEKEMPWHQAVVWSPRYASEPPVTCDILHPDPAHGGETSGQATIGEGAVWTVTPQRTPVKVTAKAERRSQGYEKLLEELYIIIQDETRNADIPLTQIEVLANWSHEYVDETGIVIYIEIRGSSDDRFALWDALALRFTELEATLPDDERNFLMNNVSIEVERIE